MASDYDAAIAYLERLVALPVQIEPGVALQRVDRLLAFAGHPQEGFVTLHVTGSSGKGSTATMAAAILRAAGYRVGLFTSPHLHDYTERIAVDGVPIAQVDWTRLLSRLRPLVEDMAANSLPGYTLGRPALLEVLWPLAALYFVERGVEVAVVEVGMGGRDDPTNRNNARVGIITNVSLEHTRRLGPTIAAIARHKAGIAKRGGIVVTAAQPPEAIEAIAAECAQQGATLWRVTPSQGHGTVCYTGDEAYLGVATPLRTHEDLHLALRGRHQRANAACAVAAVDALEALALARVSPAEVQHGLATAGLPGRLEWVEGDPPVLLDGAHNPDAARALAAALRELLPGQAPVLLLGILGDKDYSAMVEALTPLAGAVVVTEPPWEGRAGRGPEVAGLAAQRVSDVTFLPDVPAALAQARRLARERQAPLVVTGSLILVGAVRELLAVSDE